MQFSVIRLLATALIFCLFAGPVQAASTTPGTSDPSLTQMAPKVQVVPVVEPSTHFPHDDSGTPTLSESCWPQANLIGTDLAGVITVGGPTSGWKLGCAVNFVRPFRTPVCVAGMSEGSTLIGNRVVIANQKPELIHLVQLEHLSGGEKINYTCFEGSP